MTAPLRAAPRARAPYASDPAASRGRLHAEPESATRTAFQRDRDRIIHSGAFRRLKHKTQVFVFHEGDYYRTRLTHSLEVAQIARSIARVLRLDDDLAEALALAHDLGHTCFGHAGEDALAGCMAPYGGFDHNAHALRLVTRLERRYIAFDGLNLSWETLEGLVKHNGPLVTPGTPLESLPEAIRDYAGRQDLELHTHAGPEAQVAALSDDIAYDAHDIDDGLRAGLFTIEELRAVPLIGAILGELLDRHPAAETQLVAHEAVRSLIGAMVSDVLAETSRRLAALAPADAAAVRASAAPVVAFSAAMTANDRALKQFLFERMYRHYRVNRMTAKARRIVEQLFTAFLGDPSLLPQEWRRQAGAAGDRATARVVSDYIAGMTDRFAAQEHGRLFQIDFD